MVWGELRHRIRPGAAIAVALAAALVAIFLLSRGGDDEPTRATPVGASAAELSRAADEARLPVHWAGEMKGMQFELSQTSDGSIYVRYLPEGTAVGDERADFLTVGTYPVKNALDELRRQAEQVGVKLERGPRGALAYSDPTNPSSVYLAYPRADFEVEVFDPDPERAAELVRSGRIVPIP